MKLILVLATLKLVATPALTIGTAQAQTNTDWYVLAGDDHKCHPATTMQFRSPQAAIDFLRGHSIIPGVDVHPFGDGRWVSITLRDNDQDVSMNFFSTQTSCEAAISKLKASGIIPDQGDLN
jgi:hypothetical protein